MVLVALLVAAGVYAFLHREELGLVVPPAPATAPTPGDAAGATEPAPAAAHPAPISWQTINRPQDGFKLEMPSDPKDLRLPAYNENGGAEAVHMIYSNPDSATTFSVSWADSPPVARSGNQSIDQVMNTARDGALERTQTSLLSESRSAPGGNPARDFLARNAGGGVIDTRLLMAGKRLYMLSATFPSMSARREQDVTRFFSSFTAFQARAIPTTMPPANPPATQN